MKLYSSRTVQQCRGDAENFFVEKELQIYLSHFKTLFPTEL